MERKSESSFGGGFALGLWLEGGHRMTIVPCRSAGLSCV